MNIERRATARNIKTYKIVIEFSDTTKSTCIVNANSMWDAIRLIKEYNTSQNLTVKFITGQELPDGVIIDASLIGDKVK